MVTKCIGRQYNFIHYPEFVMSPLAMNTSFRSYNMNSVLVRNSRRLVVACKNLPNYFIILSVHR